MSKILKWGNSYGLRIGKKDLLRYCGTDDVTKVVAKIILKKKKRD